MLTDQAFKDLDRSGPEQAGDEPDDNYGDETGTTAPLHERLETIAARVRKRDIVGVIVFDASPLETWEHRNGSESFDALMEKFIRALRSIRGSSIRRDDIVCRNATAGDSALVFLSRPRNRSEEKEALDFDRIAERTKEYATGKIAESNPDLRETLQAIELGTSLIVGKKSIDPRRQIHRAVRSAHQDIRERKKKQHRELHHVVGTVIAQRDIETLYQPIVELDDRSTFGYEALSRAATGLSEQLGASLFSAASKVELDVELDTLCRTLSVDRRPAMSGEDKLFINCLPAAFYEPGERLEAILDEWMRQEGLEPHQLIFELNENISQTQADRILPTIRRLRDRGLQFALDDMGTGMTNLRLLADLEPTFIKMDISLTRGIGDCVRKQALASYLLDLARKSDARLIAEGIESEEDLETVVELGVDYGQGHLIGEPREYDEYG